MSADNACPPPYDPERPEAWTNIFRDYSRSKTQTSCVTDAGKESVNVSAGSPVFLVAVAMMNMAEQADHQVAASEARATALGAPPLTAASLAADGAAAASTSVSAAAARAVNKKADEIRDRHDKAVHVALDPPDGASVAEKNACKKACMKYCTLGLNTIDEIQFKSQGKISQLMNKLTDDSGVVAASLRIALGADACHAARAAISAGGFHFDTSADGIGMWKCLLTYIKTPTAQLIAHTALNMEWTACIQGDDETPSAFVTRFAMLVNRFQALGRSLSEDEIIIAFDLKASENAAATAVTAGAKSWADIQTAVSAKSTTDTARQLLRVTPGLPTPEAAAAAASSQEPATTPAQADNASYTPTCWGCGKKGHRRQQCPDKKTKKDDTPRSAASAAVADSDSDDDDPEVRFSLAAATTAGAAGTTGDLFGALDGGPLVDGDPLMPSDDHLESDHDGDDLDTGSWQCVDEQPERPTWSLSMPTLALPTVSMPFARAVLLAAILFGMLQAVATEAVKSVGPAQANAEEAYWFPTEPTETFSEALMTSGMMPAMPSVTEVNASVTPIHFGTAATWPVVTDFSETTTMAMQTGEEEAYWSLATASDGANQMLSDGGDGARELQNHTAPASATEALTKSNRSSTTEASAIEALTKFGTMLGESSTKEASVSRALTKSSTTLDERRGGGLGDHDTRIADHSPPLKSGGWYRSYVVVLKDERRGGTRGEYDTRFAKRRGGTLGEYDTRFADPSLKSGGLYRSAIEPLVMGAGAIMALIIFHREKQRGFQNNEETNDVLFHRGKQRGFQNDEGTNAGISAVRSEAVT